MGSAIKETYSEQYVTYTLELDGKFYIVEHVPAKVCLETGEHYFAPETVEKIQKIIWGQRKPVKGSKHLFMNSEPTWGRP